MDYFSIILYTQSYIDAAETEALNLAVQYLYENEQPKYTYRWQLDEIFAKREWAAIGDYLNIGYFVRFSDPQFQSDPVDIRITAVKEFINKPKSPTIEIANNISPMSPRNQLNQLPTLEQTIDRKNKDAMDRAKSIARSAEELEYLRVALANNTEIDGGLILTSLIKLGAILGNDWVERAGISGASGNPDAVAFWAGGNLTDAINNLAAIILRMDGSGQLAKGNILWNALGELLLLGKLESNKDGNRIVIDPDTRTLKMISSDGLEVASLKQETNTSQNFFSGQMTLKSTFGDEITIDPYFLSIILSLDTTNMMRLDLNPYGSGYRQGLFMGKSEDFNGQNTGNPLFYCNPYGNVLTLILKNLPTSPDGLISGQCWNNNGVPNLVS